MPSKLENITNLYKETNGKVKLHDTNTKMAEKRHKIYWI